MLELVTAVIKGGWRLGPFTLFAIVGIMGAEELEDYLELRDPKVRAHIRKSHAEHVAGKGRPLAEFLAAVQPPKKTAVIAAVKSVAKRVRTPAS